MSSINNVFFTLLKTVSLGGAWHSEEEDEETLLTNPIQGLEAIAHAV